MGQIVGELLLGWLLADLVTGIFHWWEDTYGQESWPVIGPWLIAPNRLHHSEPLRFLEGTFWNRNGASMIAAVVLGTPLVWLLGPSVWLLTFLVGAALANEVHAYAHQPSKAPAVVRLFQQTGLLQAPKSHAAHHRPPQDVNFCVLTDLLNPFVEAARLRR